MTFIYLYTVVLALKGIIVNGERQITGELISNYLDDKNTKHIVSCLSYPVVIYIKNLF